MVEDIAESCRRLEFVRSIEASGSTIVANVQSGEMEYLLEVDFKKPFPKVLPPIKLRSAGQYGYLPHVCWESLVCYNDGEGLSIDYSRPRDVAVHALKQAVGVLPTDNGFDLADFYNEYEGYWNQQDGIASCQLFFEPGSDTREIRVIEDKKGKALSIISSHRDENLSSHYVYANRLNANKTELRGYYLPLDTCAEPPLPGEKLSIQFLDRVIASLSEENLRLWNEIVQGGDLPKRLTLLVSQPRPSGGRSFYGVTLPAPAVKAWLDNKVYDRHITPLGIRRHTKDFLIERGGLGSSSDARNVAVVGCGALGCRVAELCLMSGLTNMTLIDGQSFSEENIFRHILDSCFIGVNKAKALQESFLARFPGVSVEAIPKQVQSIEGLFDNHDVVIVAIGNPTLEREFNLQHQDISGDQKTTVITTWLEAGGVGGHAVVANGQENGCLHCLYHQDNSPTLSSITSLIEPGQIVTRNLTGCGGSFVPYGAVHAVKTAAMVIEGVLESSTQADSESRKNYRFWSSCVNGNHTHLEMSPWFYESTEAGAEEKINQILKEGCPVCR